MTDLNLRRLIATWMIGSIIGTALIAVTSPLFVRSYRAMPVDEVRRVHTLPPGSTYRWRSEGYANTRVGPLGMPGKNFVGTPSQSAKQVALWGDSQAEGVGVTDHRKLFAQMEQLSGKKLEVFPLARSGDDVSAWLAQIPRVEDKLQIDHHVLLVADLPDLLSVNQPSDDLDPVPVRTRPPAFLIQAVRNLVTGADGTTRRRLRFSLGPVAEPSTGVSNQPTNGNHASWTTVIQRLRDVTSKPIWILYAPPSPQIIGGRARFDDAASDQLAQLQLAAEGSSVRVINLHPRLCDSAREGRWPRGFHNGQIGAGHLNGDGYAVIAKAFVKAIGLED